MKNPWLNAKARILHRHIGHGRGFVSAAMFARDKFSFLKVLIDSVGSVIVPNGSKSATVKKIGGKSIVFNQMVDKSNFYATTVSNGVTFTNNGDGSITCNGTATEGLIATFTLDPAFTQKCVVGHKYYIGKINAPNVARIRCFGGYGDTYQTRIATLTQTGFDDVLKVLAINVLSGQTVENMVVTPKIFDLTQMFGSGNEPTTVAEFEAMFPDDYYPYNAGELKGAPTTAINVVGKNLVDYADIIDKSPHDISSHTIDVSNLVDGKTYVASVDIKCPSDCTRMYIQVNGSYVNVAQVTSGNSGRAITKFVKTSSITTLNVTYGSGGQGSASVTNFMLEKGTTATDFVPYHAPTTIPVNIGRNLFDGASFVALGYNNRFYSFENGNIIVNANDVSSINNRLLEFPQFKNKTMCVSVENAISQIRVFNTTLNNISDQVVAGKAYKFTVPDDGKFAIKFIVDSFPTNVGKVQLEIGSTPTSYVPHLNGYGRSAGNVYNEIDFDRKKYIQRVGVVDLGTLNWARTSSYANPFFYNNNYYTNNILNYMYDNVGYVSTDVFGNKPNMSIGVVTTNQQLYIRNDSYTNATTFKTAMNGVMLYYELATPIETDISEIIDSFDVTNGDTIEFINAINQAIPNTIEFVCDPDEYEEPTPMLMMMSDDEPIDDQIDDQIDENIIEP